MTKKRGKRKGRNRRRGGASFRSDLEALGGFIIHDPDQHHRAGLLWWHSGAIDDQGVPDQIIRPKKFPLVPECGDEFFPDEFFPDDDDKYYDGMDYENDMDHGAAEDTMQGLDGFSHIQCPASVEADIWGCGTQVCHLDSLIVAVRGACAHVGTPKTARSSYGVFFGAEGSAKAYNISALVANSDEQAPHTIQRAELHAAIEAVEAVKKFVNEGGQWPCKKGTCPVEGAHRCKVKYIVVKIDSDYLENAMTENIFKWMKNGWKLAVRRRLRTGTCLRSCLEIL